MSDNEFVILLDEPEPEAAAQSTDSGEFVVLLDAPGDGVDSKSTAAAGQFALPADCSISASNHLYQVLAEFDVAAVDAIELDAGPVASIDTAGLQLLSYYARYGRSQGKTTTLINADQSFKDSAARVGLCDELFS